MTASLTQNLLQSFLEWVELHFGLKISPARIQDFEKSVRLAARDSGFDDPNKYAAALIRGNSSDLDLSVLIRYLTIGETYFFRDPVSYTLLKTHVLPDLACQEKLTIWSAGCSTGEEPYSLAMTVLSSLGASALQRVRIIATDVNDESLAIARKGIYRRWSFRDVPAFIRDKYFTMTDEERYLIDRDIQSMVQLFKLNLADPDYPAFVQGVDIIFCRNVLIYFSPQHATSVLDRFHDCLSDGGWLFLAPSEIPHPTPNHFSLMSQEGAIVLKKEERTAATEIISIVKSNYSYFGSREADGFKSFKSLVNLTAGATEEFGGIDAMSTAAGSLSSMGGNHRPEDSISATKAEETTCQAGKTGDEKQYSFQEIDSIFKEGKYQKVINLLLERSQTLSASKPDAMVLIARSYANLGNLDTAIEWCNQVIESDFTNPRWYYLKATIQQEKGLIDEALASLRQALFLDQDYVLGHFTLGNIYRQEGSLSESRKCFKVVAELLERLDGTETIPDSDGLTAGQLASIVNSFSTDHDDNAGDREQ